MALKETRREANAIAFPLQGAVLLETSHISHDDCFAALQIVYPPLRRLADFSPPYLLSMGLFLSLSVFTFEIGLFFGV